MVKVGEFVRMLKEEVVDGNIATYQSQIDELDEKDRAKVTDPMWRALLTIYDSSDAAGRRALFAVMRLVAIDTLSNVLGIIDGSSTLPGFDGELSLKPRDTIRVEYAGYLQSEFLELIEREQR